MQKYAVNQNLIETLLAWVKSGEIAIPEIQRPFVWDASKVRDLLDSLYKGYPVGYIIVWKNPDVRLKDGSTSSGKKVLIDGQQRVTALTASLLGKKVVNKEYKPVNIAIAFNPRSETFEVSNPAIRKDKAWISDIEPLMQGNCSLPIQAPKTPQQFQSQLLCQDASFTFGYDDLRRQILILSLRL